MKGGITSGVVYPLAVCELAKVYRLRSVGGSSAGAIAAAAAAAAELGREKGGFEKLATLPSDLTAKVAGKDSRLFTLFQPQPRMRRLFRLVTAGLGTLGFTRTTAMAGAALRAWLPYAAAGAAPGVLLVVLGFLVGGPAQWVSLVAGILLALIGLVVGIGVGVFRDAGQIPSAGFGLCSGHTPPRATTPALTPWLHETFQTLAGRSVTDPPITFADLREAGITLQLMTTNLSRRQPLAMPWDGSGYYFDPAHFRTLFPEEVVEQMERSPLPPVQTDEDWLATVAAEHAAPLRHFPASADLPIVVAVRMSLSFPGLISAVPLHAVDYSRPTNKRALAAAVAWRNGAPSGDAGRRCRCAPQARAAAQLVLRRWHLRQPAAALLRLRTPPPAHVRDRPGRLPARPREERGRVREQLPAGHRQRRGPAPADGLPDQRRGRAQAVLLLDRRHRPHVGRRGPAVRARLPRPGGHGVPRPHARAG